MLTARPAAWFKAARCLQCVVAWLPRTRRVSQDRLRPSTQRHARTARRKGPRAALAEQSEAACNLVVASVALLLQTRLSSTPLSLKQAAEFRLPAPAHSTEARRALVLLLLANGKLSLVPEEGHRDYVALEVAESVHGSEAAWSMFHVLAPCLLCPPSQPSSQSSPASSDVELSKLLAEYRAHEALHMQSKARLDLLHSECLQLARVLGRTDVLEEL